MTTAELLERLRRLDVRLWAEGEELGCSAPRGVLTEELVGEIRGRKDELLTLLRSTQPRDDRVRAPAPREERGGPAPLSFSQRRLWFLDRLEPDSTVFNMPLAWTLRGPLDAAALERALGEVVRRHEVLRTRFVPGPDGAPRQVVAEGSEVRLERIELSARGVAQRREELRRRLAERARSRFDLETGNLVRPALARLGDDEHVLFLLVHHIVFDGVSADVFLRELAALYPAFEAGERPTLPAPELQYADFAVWQRERLQDEELERLLGYWRERLKGPLPVLELPTDHPRPAIQSYRGANESRPLPAGLVQRLRELARAEGATLYMVLLAAYDALLQRYTGQDDVAVGTVVANRSRRELDGLIGFFANTLVLRSDLSGDPSFRELLARVRETCLGAYEHQDLPFERLVEELQPERNLAYTPLFQTFFNLEEGAARSRRVGALALELLELESDVARTDLMVTCHQHADGLSVWAEYAAALFEADTIQRFLEHFETLLAGVAADPDLPISRLPLLTDAERDRLDAWNATAADFPDIPVHRRFEEAVDRSPQATALRFPTDGIDGVAPGVDLTLTYRELDERATRLARLLRERGVRPGALVGIALERSPDMVVALLAILKAGGAYVPLDPTYPAQRLAYMARDAGIALVVTHTSVRAALPDGVEALVLDEEHEALARQEARRFDAGIDSRSLMYVIYTSGSTGRPKGVEIEHRSASNVLSSVAREPGFGAGERLLAISTLSFDISMAELLLPLVAGGEVVVAPQAVTADGAGLARLIARLRPGVLQATPATWRLLLLGGWEGDPDLRIFVTGEALPRDLADELLARGREVWNLYGPTESTIWGTLWRVRSGGPILIGHPVANGRCYVVDQNLAPVPLGVPGELLLGGVPLARGYHDRPELTAERFVPDPFAGDGARVYRTGDLARWRADGEIECLGRIDHQVKLRGFRIELGEIESVLSEVPGVRQCVCGVREDEPGDRRLVAYYVLEPGAEVAAARLRARAREILPAYMVPSSFACLDELPHTPNGKVDRRALLALDAVSSGHESDHVPPRTERERRIAQVWQEVLRLERVSIHSNFFDVGGHSLLLAQVHVRLQQSLDPTLSIVDLFQFPTVEALALHLEAKDADEDGASSSGRSRADRGRDLAEGRKALMQRKRRIRR